MLNFLLEVLFPKKCVSCNKNGGYFCEECSSNILQGDLICPICEKLAGGGKTHPSCKKIYGLDGLWSLGLYRNPLRLAIQFLKYRHIEDLADILVDITIKYWVKYQPFILDTIKQDKGKGWVVIPVPLHWFRENKRGFNQSSLFGKTFSRKLGLNYTEGLRRIRYTKFQARLKGVQRTENIKNAFVISPKYHLNSNNCVLLIDDVWTTGATMQECCYILKQAGIKNVWGITLAR